MKKRVGMIALLVIVFIITGFAAFSEDKGNSRELTVLFTADIHSYFDVYSAGIEGEVREHGGAGRLMTLIRQNSNDHSVYVDAGDFAMGTLLHAGYATDAYELRLLGEVGCDATTFGNHEFDFGGYGAAKMLRSALRSGEKLPQIVIPANLAFSDEMTAEQKDLYDALNECGAQRYMIREINGIKVAIFGLMGKEAAGYTPTSGVIWNDPIKSAKETVKEIGGQAEVIICLSHSGTNGDGKSGEDFDLIKSVPELDVVISGHSHTIYHEVYTKNGAWLSSCGSYLAFVGKMELEVDEKGDVICTDYTLIPCDENVESDAEVDSRVAGFKKEIEQNYLADADLEYDTVIAHSDFDFMTLDNMYESWEEYPMGEMIADSYMYAFEQNGIYDVDVSMVGLGTIRSSLVEGDITVADAFEACSLGMGVDGSAGHPILAMYVKGSDLKLLTELEAVAGGLMSSFRMSYSGLSYTYDMNRVPLDRVRDLRIERKDGTSEPVEDSKLYKVGINMYAANLLGQIKSMSYGLVNFVPRNADGSAVDMDNLYAYSLIGSDGSEVKEWEAFRDYLMSFEKRDGVPVIPEVYREPLNRKVRTAGSFPGILSDAGTSTCVAVALAVILTALIIVLIATRKKRKARREARRAKKMKT